MAGAGGWSNEKYYCSPDISANNLFKSYLNKLILEVLEAIKTDRGHVTILHGDGAFSLFVLPEEREILQKWILLAQAD